MFSLDSVTTRMHSSRMRTVRCSSRLLGVEVGRLSARGVGLGRVCPEGMSAQTVGVCPDGGQCLSQCMLGYTPPPPWTEFLTHTCENIAFLQLRLRTVKNNFFKKIILTCHVLCKRPRCYHSACKTQVIREDLSIEPNSCFSDLSDSLNSLNF